MASPTPAPAAAPTVKRRFIGRNPATASKTTAAGGGAPPPLLNQIPAEIQDDPLINASIDALLPKNYNFEVKKTIWQIRKFGIQRVALQMPEGLAMFGTSITDLVEMHTEAEAVILADVTYGACCVDDYTAKALGCDMLVHYGHSCLIPIDTTTIRCLYVFVEIAVDTSHLLDTVKLNFPSCLPSSSSSAAQAMASGAPALSIDGPEESAPSASSEGAEPSAQTCHLAVVGTVQFLAAVHGLKASLEGPDAETSLPPQLAITSGEAGSSPTPLRKSTKWQITIPQVKPLSPGEILGCTAPRLTGQGVDALLYVGDGRFHLESIMIANPTLPAYRYDPYSKKLTREEYDHTEMLRMRSDSITAARRSLPAVAESPDSTFEKPERASPNWAVVLGTLGRQGSLSVLKTVTSSLPLSSTVPILLSELSPAKLGILAPFIDTFVQTSCPRLSIDWGYAFPRPLLSTYEASVALGKVKSRWLADAQAQPQPASRGRATKAGRSGVAEENRDYPMDFYADESLGSWTPRWHVGERDKERRDKREQREKERAAAAAAAGRTQSSAVTAAA